MDTWEVREAVEALEGADSCQFFDTEFQNAIATLRRAGRELIDLKDEEPDLDLIKDTVSELRNEVENAQGTLSDLDDKFGDIYSKLDDVDCAVEELER